MVIVGGGFAGLQAAMHLAGKPVEVMLVDRRNHHTFQPLLYQVALAALSPGDIAQPIRSIFRNRQNVDVLMDEVVGIDAAAKSVHLHSSANLHYDYLILATGSTHSYFGHDDWEPYAPGLKTVEDAIEIRRRVLLAFELAERAGSGAWLASAVEFRRCRRRPNRGRTGRCDFRYFAALYAKGFSPHRSQPGARDRHGRSRRESWPPIRKTCPAKHQRNCTASGRRGQKQRHVTDVQPGYVVANGERIESVVTLWAAGVQASPLGKMLGAEMDKQRRNFRRPVS